MLDCSRVPGFSPARAGGLGLGRHPVIAYNPPVVSRVVHREVLTGVSPWLVIFATFGCGSAERTSGAPPPGGGGTAGVGAAGSGGASGASSAGRGGAAAGGGASSAGTTSASTAGMPNYPPDSIVLGPFALNGGISSSGDDHDYDFSLPEQGHAWFRATGSARVGQILPVTTGLVRPPASSSIGANWLCPGPGATWKPTETDDAASDCGARSSWRRRSPCGCRLSATKSPTTRVTVPATLIRSKPVPPVGPPIVKLSVLLASWL